ncbi:CapA family protein [Planococcus shenhongbingii]|uniref:CapA family protein n=1 Tax=Planococcus shenhongbingii TaxID=3058398 RepID=A0ABT8NF36_9BACL|nr:MULTISPECIES: CapA family protein [unclassified Planococcus (in: firmicutes)]MDN7246482.1 CapA family protein [Planococcus sp. N017]WKA59472.1 CapA family protein [Planococcus sp. N016]
MKKNQKSMILLFILLVLFLSGCFSETGAPIAKVGEFETRKAPVAVIPSKLVKTSVASLSAVGDILIHERVYLDAQTENGYDFNPMFAEVKPFLEKSDITIANSESIVGGNEVGLSTYPSFNSPFEVADAMKSAGIDVVSMANNHTLDRGEKAIVSALKYWDKIGMTHTGASASEEERNQIPTITKNGIVFSFLSYTYGTNGIPTPKGKDYLLNRIDKAKMKTDLIKAKAASDVVVLSLHFGNEYETMPTDEQKELAHFAAEQGADLILGHHPHVLQPAEWIETTDGKRSFAIYSLGNFLSGQEGLQRQIGGILHIHAKKTIDANSTTIVLKEPSFTPTYVESQNHKNYKITLLKNADPAANQAIKDHLSLWVKDLAFDE